MIRRIEKLFNDQIRPALLGHGGNVEIIDLDNDVLYVKFIGGCQGCSSSAATLKGGIENLVFTNFPEIKNILDITEHDKGENPYYK